MKKTILAAIAAVSTAVATAVALGATAPPAAASASTPNPGFSATFVSPYWFDGNDDAAQLQTQFAAQRQAGVDTVIVEWSAHEDAMDAAYPASASLGYSTFNDAVPQIVAAAQRNGLKVWMGLIVAPDLFSEQSNYTSASFLAAQATKFDALADDLYSKYGSTIAGWYIPVEPGQDMVKTPAGAAQIGGWLGSISSYLHGHDGSKPVMVSPSMPSAEAAGLSPDQFVNELQPMIAAAHVDVWNLQDGFEMTSWTPEQEATAFAHAQVLVQKYRSSLWAAVYTPATDGNGAVPVSRLLPYLGAIAATGTPLSSWEFAQYLDPDASQKDGSAMTANLTAYESYLSAPKPAAPTSVATTAQSSTDVLVRWAQASDSSAPVAAYQIWRRTAGVWEFVAQTGRAGAFVDDSAQPGSSYSYRVVSVSNAGADSSTTSSITGAEKTAGVASAGTDGRTTASDSATTSTWPAGTLRSSSYTISANPADDVHSYPDSGKLTDGTFAADTGFWTAGWTGVNVADQGTVSYTIDLGAAHSISAFDSRWLYTPSAGITLPGSVSYAVSTDGTSFTTRATVGSLSGKTVSNVDGQVLDYAAGTSPVSARYVRVTVSQPQGGWIFTDQLMVR